MSRPGTSAGGDSRLSVLGSSETVSIPVGVTNSRLGLAPRQQLGEIPIRGPPNGAFRSSKIGDNLLCVSEKTGPKLVSSAPLSQEPVERAEAHSIALHLRQQPSSAATFQLLRDALHGRNPVSILSQLTVRFLFVRRGEFHEESSEIHRYCPYIEFLTGLLATQPFPSGELEELTAFQCDEIWRRLQDYFDAVQRALIADALEKTDLVHELQFDARNHSLMVRGEAYPHQLEHMAAGLYAEHEAWFQRTLGFTIREALHAIQAVVRLSEWRRGQALSNLGRDSEDRSARTEDLTQYAEAIISFSVDDLAIVSELPVVTCASLLERLA